MASCVLLAFSATILSASAGFADVQGKELTGVRRAASQLDKRLMRGEMVLQRARFPNFWFVTR